MQTIASDNAHEVFDTQNTHFQRGIGLVDIRKRTSSVKKKVRTIPPPAAETVKYLLATNFSFLRRNFTF